MIQTLLPNASGRQSKKLSTSKPFSQAMAALPWAAMLRRIPGLLILSLVPWSLYGPLVFPLAFGMYFFFLHGLFLANNIRSAYGVWTAYTLAKVTSTTNYLAKYITETGTRNGSDLRHDLPFDAISHVIILPNYKETLETLCETLDICLAMEESEEKCTLKAQNLIKMYSDFFYEISYTVHPKGRDNEIRGKSSNVAWAASQMALRTLHGPSGSHSHEILTIMDADTCFAEDYFNCVSYHYATASPEQRRIMMFAPSTVFDRNADQVPVFVRVTDMFWSIGVMSNLYPSSNIKLPCSAYSVSLDLALSVNFWDTGPEAIGEDMHMYLKCFFATEGRVIVKSIFSPASQCNVQGEGFGISGWLKGISARYSQAKRHLWGSLDTTYAIRRLIFALLMPGSETVVNLKNSKVDKLGKLETNNRLSWMMIASLFHRLLEAHILMGHLFFMISVTAFIVPFRASSALHWLYGSLAEAPLQPLLVQILSICLWMRTLALIPNVFMVYYYEKYHQWVAVDRWRLQAPKASLTSMGRRVDSAVEIPECLIASESNGLLVSNENPGSVQYLGKRGQLLYQRTLPADIKDWVAIPFAGLFFYIAPQFHAQICHLWTDSLEYKVAAKPQLNRPPSVVFSESLEVTPIYEAGEAPLDFSIRIESIETKSITSNVSTKGDEGFFEEFESDTASHGEHRDRSPQRIIF